MMHVTQRRADDFEPSGGGTVHHIVERGQARAKELFEADALFREPGKDEAAVVLHIANAAHALAAVGLFQPGILVAFFERDRQKAAVSFEAPCMIGTPEEFAGVALPVDDDFRALMRATVQQHMDVAGGMTHLNDRLGADMGAEIIALVRGLAFVADKDPSIGEEMLHLLLEHLRVGVDIAVHLMWLHESGQCRRAVVTSHEFLPQMSSTRRGDLARLTQICMTLPAARSASDSTTSR